MGHEFVKLEVPLFSSTTLVPFEATKHLCMAQELPKVNVKHVSCASKHYVIIVSITDA